MPTSIVRRQQFETEFNAVNEMYLKYFKIFGIEKYVMRFSTHDPAKLGEKYVNEPALWKETEDMVRAVLHQLRHPVRRGTQRGRLLWTED